MNSEEISDVKPNSHTSSNDNQNTKKNERWHCPICKEELKSPVVTPCGHIFCWPCFRKYLQNEEEVVKVCPICSKPVDVDKVVPIYGQTNQSKDKEVPPPPKPERVETEEEIRGRNQNNFFNQNNNFNFEFGLFPFGAGFGFTYRNGVGFQAHGGNGGQGLRSPIILLFLFFFLPTIIMMLSSNYA